MTLTWKAIGDDIILQEGAAAYNYKASGTIKAGQLVKVKDTMEVKVCSDKDDTGCVGVSAYDVTDNEYLAVWGPGNIVRVRISGAATVGDDLQAASDTEDGYLASRTAVAGAKVGVALETVTADTTNGTVCRVLLV